MKDRWWCDTCKEFLPGLVTDSNHYDHQCYLIPTDASKKIHNLAVEKCELKRKTDLAIWADQAGSDEERETIKAYGIIPSYSLMVVKEARDV